MGKCILTSVMSAGRLPSNAMGVSLAMLGSPRSAPAARSSCRISCWPHLRG